MKVQKTTPQPIYDAEQFDGVNVPRLLLDENGELNYQATWAMPELDWREARKASRPMHAPVLEVTTLNGTARMHGGFWVLRNEAGFLEVWDDAWFRQNFTPIEDADTDMTERVLRTMAPAIAESVRRRERSTTAAAEANE